MNFSGYAGLDDNSGPRYTLDDGAQEIPLFRQVPSKARNRFSGGDFKFS
jgi:hypothetical protein